MGSITANTLMTAQMATRVIVIDDSELITAMLHYGNDSLFKTLLRGQSDFNRRV